MSATMTDDLSKGMTAPMTRDTTALAAPGAISVGWPRRSPARLGWRPSGCFPKISG